MLALNLSSTKIIVNLVARTHSGGNPIGAYILGVKAIRFGLVREFASRLSPKTAICQFARFGMTDAYPEEDLMIYLAIVDNNRGPGKDPDHIVVFPMTLRLGSLGKPKVASWFNEKGELEINYAHIEFATGFIDRWLAILDAEGIFN
jgi:hypothetical protein